MTERAPLRIGCLVSGRGRSLQNLIRAEKDGSLKGVIVVVVSSHARAPAIDISKKAGINTFVVDYTLYKSDTEFSNEITSILNSHCVELVVMAGFIRKYLFPKEFDGKVINIHPALLPKYSGKGYYGAKVHEAVLKSGDKETGCTVHYATHDYDSGPIIIQERIPVRSDDNTETLATRVFELECAVLPKAINLIWAQKA